MTGTLIRNQHASPGDMLFCIPLKIKRPCRFNIRKLPGANMYLAFKHSHLLTAALSMLLTVTWSIFAWHERDGTGGTLVSKIKAIYIIHRVVAGLAGITGLAVTLIGPWRVMVFPYIGLAAFVVHGIAATVSKRTFGDRHATVKRQAALLIQIAAIVLSAYVMTAKHA